MKNILKIVSIALVSVFTLSAATCFGQSGGGGRTLNSAEDLKKYFESQPANRSDNPIKVTINANDQTIKDIAEVIKYSDKYVSLNLSGNALTTIPNNAFRRSETLVGVTIPNSVTGIRGMAFEGCYSLDSITFEGANTIISGGFPEDFGDLLTKYLAGGRGKYKKIAGVHRSSVWTKQN